MGPVTASELQSNGLKVDYTPAEAVSVRIAEGFPGALEGQQILIPRAKIAPDDLPKALEAKGARVTVLPVYETVPDEGSPAVRELAVSGEARIVTFTSSSTVRNFARLVTPRDLHPSTLTACIGPVTAETARELGYRVAIIAEEHTMPGLVRAILKQLAMERNQQEPAGTNRSQQEPAGTSRSQLELRFNA